MLRRDDEQVLALVRPLDHAPTRVTVSAERAFLERVGGGCQVPVGAHARVEGGSLLLAGLIGSREGQLVRAELAGRTSEPASLGIRLARTLLNAGGLELLPRGEQDCAAP